MSSVERITVTMPAEMARYVREAVDAGFYASTSEIVREALRDWFKRQDEDARELAALREAIAEGDAGDAIPAEQVIAEIRSLLAERKKKAA